MWDVKLYYTIKLLFYNQFYAVYAMRYCYAMLMNMAMRHSWGYLSVCCLWLKLSCIPLIHRHCGIPLHVPKFCGIAWNYAGHGKSWAILTLCSVLHLVTANRVYML